MTRIAVRVTMGVGALVAALVGTIDTAHAAVLCAKVRSDGRFSGAVKIRDACRDREMQLAPEDVGFCCGPASTTSTTGPSPTSTTPTPTTAPTPTTVPTTTTTTVAAVCGNNVIEGGEVCDCGIPPCFPSQAFSYPNRGGCPIDPDGRWTFCAQDCSACQPAPRCADGVYDPGDTCDYLGGNLNDNCASGSVCLTGDPCVCSCAGPGRLCMHGTSCCSGYTCVDSVCQ